MRMTRQRAWPAKSKPIGILDTTVRYNHLTKRNRFFELVNLISREHGRELAVVLGFLRASSARNACVFAGPIVPMPMTPMLMWLLAEVNDEVCDEDEVESELLFRA